MTDCAAKSHTGSPNVEDAASHIRAHVHARPCVYERRVFRSDQHMRAWELADRRAFTEARLRGRAYVRTKLSATTRAGSTTAGVTGPLWTDVVKAGRRLNVPLRDLILRP